MSLFFRRAATLLLLVGPVGLSACADQAPGPATDESLGVPEADQAFPPDEALGPMLRYVVEDGVAPGMVLGLLEADGTSRVLVHGDPGPGVQEPLGGASVFEIASVSKVFTGTLLADMVARGEVGLDDPVARHLPDGVSAPSRDGREITLLDLATHTSGLPGAPDHEPADPLDPWSDWTVERLYAWLSDHELERVPGSEYEYSNLGMGLLGHALAQAADMGLPDLMAERVFEPLGMNRTGYSTPEAATTGLVRGHQLSDPVPHWTTTAAIEGAGGIRSTADDLLRFVAANVGPPRAALERAMGDAHEPQRPGPGSERIGLAWVNSDVAGRRIVRHSGSTGGFRAEIAFDPERRIGVVVLVNSGGYRESLAHDLVSGRLPPSRAEVETNPATLAEYPGVYESDNGLPLYVALDNDGRLTGQAPNQVRFRLYGTSDSTFYAKRVPFTLAFRRDGDGVVEDLILGVGSNTNRFRRVGGEVPDSRVVARTHVEPLSREAIATYAGTYLLDVAGTEVEVRIYGEGDRLLAEIAGQTVSRLVPRGEHAFALAANPRERVVFIVEGGRVVRAMVTRDGATYRGVPRGEGATPISGARRRR